MSETPVDAPEVTLPPEVRSRGQAAITSVTVYDTVLFGTALGSVASLFVLNVGGSSFHVALLATAGQIAPLAQVVGLRLLPRVGKARLVMGGHVLASIPLVLLALLAISGMSGPPAAWAAVAAVAVFSLVFTVGQTAWWPAIQDNTAGDAVEPFFARMRTRYQLVGVVVSVSVAFFMGRDPAHWRFMLTFLCGAAALVLGGLCMRVVSERPFVPAKSGLFDRLLAASRVPSIRRYISFVACRVAVFIIATPFWVVILKKHGLSEGFIVWLSAVVALGNVSGVRWWGRFVNRWNFRAAITIALLSEALLGLAWLAFPAEGHAVKVWAVIFYALWGFLEGGYLMGWTRAMLGSIPSSSQADGFTLATVVCSLAGAAAGLLGGTIFNALAETQIGGISGWMLYLCIAQLLFAGAWLMSFRLKGYTEQVPARRLVTVFFMLIVRRAKRLVE